MRIKFLCDGFYLVFQNKISVAFFLKIAIIIKVQLTLVTKVVQYSTEQACPISHSLPPSLPSQGGFVLRDHLVCPCPSQLEGLHYQQRGRNENGSSDEEKFPAF